MTTQEERDELRRRWSNDWSPDPLGLRLLDEQDSLEAEVATLKKERDELAYEVRCHEAVAWLCGEDEGCYIIGGKFALLCSDTFGYACADCEELDIHDAPMIKALVKEQGWPAVVRWVAQVRGSKPLAEVTAKMKTVDQMRERAEKAEAEVATLRAENEKLKTKPECIQTDSGYACSHCGTTLRADSPDFVEMDRRDNELIARRCAYDSLLARFNAQVEASREENEKLKALANPYPEPDQQRCKRCGRADGLDCMVPNALWDSLLSEARRQGMDSGNVLCLWCMDALAAKLGMSGYVALHFAGRALSSSNTEAEQLTKALSAAKEREERLTRVLKQAHVLFEGLGYEGSCMAIDAALAPAQQPEPTKGGVERMILKTTRPKIVCLCGSTRFKDAFDEANYQETMSGRIVLSVGFFLHATNNRHGEGVGATPEQKRALDELHKRKIDLADEVLVLNVGGYIGSSTRSEIDYATANGVPVRYLEPTKGGVE